MAKIQILVHLMMANSVPRKKKSKVSMDTANPETKLCVFFLTRGGTFLNVYLSWQRPNAIKPKEINKNTDYNRLSTYIKFLRN